MPSLIHAVNEIIDKFFGHFINFFVYVVIEIFWAIVSVHLLMLCPHKSRTFDKQRAALP